MKGSILHQNGSHGATAAVKLGFKNAAHGLAPRRSLGRFDVAHQADHFEKQIEIDALLGRNLDKNRARLSRAGPFLGNQAAVGELLFDAIGVGFGLVDLVHGYDDRNLGGLGVIDGLEGLRHYAVVRRNHDDDDIRHFGAAGAHAGECFVARRVEEDDFAARCRRAFLGELHFVRADMLRDSARLAGGNVGFADGVEQRSLAVIHMAHDRDHGRARHFELIGVFGFEHFFNGLVGEFFLVADDGGGGAELGGHVLHHLRVERLIHRNEDAAHEQRGDEILGARFKLLGQVLHADPLRDRDVAGDGYGLGAVLRAAIAWRRHKALHRAFFGLRILLLASSAATGTGALRARGFTCRRCGARARTRPKAWAGAESWTSAKTGPSAGSREATGR